MESVLGTRDIYPKEARMRKKIRETLCALFESWGYEEVEPPTIESYQILSKTIGEEIRRRMYQFVNREGKLVCLRPEFTTSVARMFVKERHENLPWRVYYAGKIFRYPTSPFRLESELTQIGVENIGSNTTQSDGEVIALAIASLREIKVQEFQMDIGHVGIFRYLLSQLPLEEEEKNRLKDLTKKRDFVALEEFWCRKKLEKHPAAKFFLNFPFLRGKKEIIPYARELFGDSGWIATLSYLEEIFQRLEDFGFGDRVFLNLGLIRDFDYYTGVIWEGFSSRLGYPILAGGRYDELLGLLGKNLPACGFALFLERVMEVFHKEDFPQQNFFSLRFFYPPKWRSQAFQIVENIRKKGFSVVMEEVGEEEFVLSTPQGTFRFSLSEAEKIELVVKELRLY